MTLTVPGPGTIVVEATSTLVVDQTGYSTPQSDYASLFITEDPNVCNDPSQSQQAFDAIDHYERHIFTLPSRRITDVTAAGTRSFYLNGLMFQGKDASDRFDRGTMIATYYPAASATSG